MGIWKHVSKSCCWHVGTKVDQVRAEAGWGETFVTNDQRFTEIFENGRRVVTGTRDVPQN